MTERSAFLTHSLLRLLLSPTLYSGSIKGKRSRLMDGNSSEGNNWWMWMVRASDNASLCPGLCTGRNNRAQSMKVFGVVDD